MNQFLASNPVGTLHTSCKFAHTAMRMCAKNTCNPCLSSFTAHLALPVDVAELVVLELGHIPELPQLEETDVKRR